MKPFLIAEIGINHNGDINLAKEMIKMARDCNWDAVKFQKRTVDIVYSSEYLNLPRDSPWGKTQRKQKEGLEFSKDEYDEIDLYCKDLGIDWFASAWDIESQIFLEKYNLKYNKVASAMLTNKPLLEHISKQNKLTFISTGLSNIYDIDKAHNIFTKNNCPHVIMHCVSEYPCPVENLNLNMINTLKKRYDVEIGYSGHSPGIMDSISAMNLGCKYIEKHITLDRAMYGSDQSASIENNGMEELAKWKAILPIMLGDGKKRITKTERKITNKLRYWK